MSLSKLALRSAFDPGASVSLLRLRFCCSSCSSPVEVEHEPLYALDASTLRGWLGVAFVRCEKCGVAPLTLSVHVSAPIGGAS